MQADMVTLLTRQEGVKYFPYDDATGEPLRPGGHLSGCLTVGIGHNLTANGISPAIAQAILAEDIFVVEQHLAGQYWWSSLDPVRRDVIANMAFNMGIHGVLGFHSMIWAIERQNWTAASAAMLNSDWAGQVPTRAKTLAAIMLAGSIEGGG